MDQKNKARDAYGEFWEYLSDEQKNLILEGMYLMNDVIKSGNYSFKDYSFLVFPIAKAYEGYLKKIFFDLKMINRLDYISDHLRLGKLMSPNLVQKLGDRSLYLQVSQKVSEDFAKKVWDVWQLGRNQIFHYFPHNTRSVSFQEAEAINDKIIQTMEEIYQDLKLKIVTNS